METPNLIDALTKDLKPVTPLRSPEKRFAIGLFVGLCFVAAVIVFEGLRRDLSQVVGSSRFYIEVGLTLVVSLSSGLCAFFLSVPGDSRWRPAFRSTVLFTFVWVVYLLTRFLEGHSGTPGLSRALTVGVGCAETLFMSALVPMGVFLWLIRRAAPLRPYLSGGLTLLSVGALGMAAVQVMCPGEDIFHLLFWHFLPVGLLTGLGGFIGRLALIKKTNFDRSKTSL